MSSDEPIYLDHNATTPLLPEVVDAMLPYLREHFGNPSSGHVYGRRTHEAVERARGQVAALIGCESSEVLFTSGGTEANNLAILGTTRALAETQPKRRRVLSSVIEHPATVQPCRWLEQQGYALELLEVDAKGRVRMRPDAVDSSTALVTVMHANNETGVVQEIAELAALASEHGALMHTDAAQSAGKFPVKVDQLGVDLLSLAGHKLYAPKGVGALYLRADTPLAPFMRGAGHERGLRPGTENVASIVGLGAACAAAERDLELLMTRMQVLRDRLMWRLAEAIPGLRLNGHNQLRLPNTLNLRFPGVSGEALLARAPSIAASTGSACHAGHTSASAVIRAMGVPEDEALGSVRLSLGRHTDEEQIDRAAAALVKAWQA